MSDLTCAHCGHVGPDVVAEPRYVGGQGYVISNECRQFAACWERWATTYLGDGILMDASLDCPVCGAEIMGVVDTRTDEVTLLQHDCKCDIDEHVLALEARARRDVAYGPEPERRRE